MALSNLLRIIALLYKMTPDEVKALSAELLTQRKAVWADALRTEAQFYGCNKTPNAPSGADLRELKALSDEDAKSIAATWQRDVERQLVKLFNANPKGNRYYYRKNMEAWAEQRATWKSPQIALNTETVTREYARSRFRDMNLTADQRYIFTGPAPTCKKCVRQFAAGVVTLAHTRRFPCPIHINCPHQWKPATRTRLDCATIWVG